MKREIDIQILDSDLSIDVCYDFVKNESSGAVTLFVGTIRDHNKGKRVEYIDFESYKPMALKEMRKIAVECKEKFEIKKICMHHFEGRADILTKAVIIAVSSVHRKESFEACSFLIDNLKRKVPIWKKEFLIDGSYWVNARP
jgi:molybdopterin synthase catalytic subunit